EETNIFEIIPLSEVVQQSREHSSYTSQPALGSNYTEKQITGHRLDQVGSEKQMSLVTDALSQQHQTNQDVRDGRSHTPQAIGFGSSENMEIDDSSDFTPDLSHNVKTGVLQVSDSVTTHSLISGLTSINECELSHENAALHSPTTSELSQGNEHHTDEDFTTTDISTWQTQSGEVCANRGGALKMSLRDSENNGQIKNKQVGETDLINTENESHSRKSGTWQGQTHCT
ncbi:unnamed protein product, partial [Lymnaea stagnalis]